MQWQKLYNPIVIQLLRSPLHGLLSRSVMLITYAGRKSDKEYTTPVSYVRHDGELFVVARARSQISGDGIMGIFASRRNVAGSHASVGRPDAEIVRLAEEVGAGLVIVGSRGLGPIRRATMGSVPESVVRYAHCPFLVVGEGRR